MNTRIHRCTLEDIGPSRPLSKEKKRKAKTEMVGFVSSVAIMITTECHSQRNKENEAKGTRSHYDRTHALA